MFTILLTYVYIYVYCLHMFTYMFSLMLLSHMFTLYMCLNVQTCSHIYLHSGLYMFTPIFTLKFTHVNLNVTNVCTNIKQVSCLHLGLHLCLQICLNTCLHTFLHTRLHTLKTRLTHLFIPIFSRGFLEVFQGFQDFSRFSRIFPVLCFPFFFKVFCKLITFF